ISPGSDFVEIGNERKHVISYLEDFLFPPQRARSPVKSLSGGERNRLLLARLFARPANILVLDEPTNDLDIDTLELLETLLQNYSGTLFLVSHDRAFIENTVTQIIAFEGNGVLTEYGGGYDDWQRFMQQKLAAQKTDVQTQLVTKPVSKTTEPILKLSKLSFKEQKELAAIPELISNLEAEQTEILAKLADGEIYRADPTYAKTLQMRLSELALTIEQAMQLWNDLESRNS
ncbi:MAG: ATP-binding cassette domain-containing protein, partial [Methylophilaceae bacterium]